MEDLFSYIFAIVILAVNDIPYAKVTATSSSNFTYTEPKNYTLHLYELARDCQELMSEECSVTRVSNNYYIKPDGHPGAFKTYCKTERDGWGWTVIQARDNTDSAKVAFNRSWEDYRLGFGTAKSNFWIGNEKLAYLTNQKQYRLRIDVTTTNGSFHVTYDNFRISDEFGNYAILQGMGGFNGTADGAVKWCPPNTHYGRCECQGTCSNLSECVPCPKHEICVCPEGYKLRGDDCVPEEHCGCPYNDSTTGISYKIREGGYNISSDCTRNCSCIDRELTCVDYQCSPHATCEVRNDARRCYCHENYTGDGTQCKYAMDCGDVFKLGMTRSGEYTVQIITGHDVKVYCDMSDGGGWTVFQRRVNGTQDFFRSREDYMKGFGLHNDEFWLGNQVLHMMTNLRRYELKIELVDKEGTMFDARYDSFSIDNESQSYTLHIGNYTGGRAGDSLTNYSDGQPFQVEVNSTWSGYVTLAPLFHADAEESSGSGDPVGSGSSYYDEFSGTEIPEIGDGDSDWIVDSDTDKLIGPWWHPLSENIPKSCDLNGDYKDIYWNTVPRTSVIRSTEMKIRPMQENV